MNAKKQYRCPRVVIGAPSSGTGKTTVTLGILQALCRRGMCVQPFKVGPDYIDPAFHSAVTKRPSINLDGWILNEETNQRLFVKYASQAQFSVIEGVMGLYDGVNFEPMNGSTAGIAKCLDAPIVLIIEAKGMAASAAALVHGMKTFQDIHLAGVIINRPSSSYHYELLKNAIETYVGVPVLGYVPRLSDVELESRHLGLIQSSEIKDLQKRIDVLADAVEDTVDLDKLIELGSRASMMEIESQEEPKQRQQQVEIAVAKDQAFSFYYEENIQMLKNRGAKISYFSPVKDHSLPLSCEGIYIGGGYPEVFAKVLQDNQALRLDIRKKAEDGMPIFAECGGYMYLHEAIQGLDEKAYEMVGIFKGTAVMTKRLQNFGYTELTGKKNTILFSLGTKVRAHEFHRSMICDGEEPCCIQAEKMRNNEKKQWYCGKSNKNVFGMYPHVYFPANPLLPGKFIEAIKAYQEKKETAKCMNT